MMRVALSVTLMSMMSIPIMMLLDLKPHWGVVPLIGITGAILYMIWND